MKSDSSDDFDTLKSTLPICERPPVVASDKSQSDDQENQPSNDFELWRLNRYNRSSNVKLTDIIVNVFNLTRKNFWFLILFLPFEWLLLIIILRFQKKILSIIALTIQSVVSISLVFSLINGEKFLNYIKQVFSFHGLITILYELTEHFLESSILSSARYRQSTIITKLIIFNFISFFFMYQPCFIFEGRGVNAFRGLSFSAKISLAFSQKNFMQFLLFFFHAIFKIFSIFSFGITAWISDALIAYSFLAICGSSACFSSQFAPV